MDEQGSPVRSRPSALTADGADAERELSGGDRSARRRIWFSAAADAGAAAAVIAVAAWLYHRAASFWWLGDDLFNLRYVLAYRPSQYCLDPAVWRQLPFRMLTPLLFVSYDVDLALFGPHPRGFHLHQLAAVALAAVALYGMLRLWLGRGWSLVGALLFLAGAPVLAVAPQVMTRQYPECCLFGLLATTTWVLGLRARRRAVGWALAVLSALLWFAAAAAKEIAVPLVLLLPLLPEGQPALRLRRLVPHAVALAVYVLYRWSMLGTIVGGYGWAPETAEWPRLALLLPVEIGRQLLGASGAAGWLALGLVMGGAVALVRRRGRAALVFAVGLLLALLPVLPVSMQVEPRYALAAWLVLVVAFVFGVRPLAPGPWIAVLALLAVTVANRQLWAREEARGARMDAEYLAIVGFGAGEVLRAPLVTPASLRELRAFGRQVLGRPISGGWFYDDVYLCGPDRPLRRLWQYDEGRRRVVEITSRLPALRRASCVTPREGHALAAAFRLGDGVLRWRLGPYSQGRWRLVFADGVEAYEVPRHGGFQIGDPTELALRVRYDSPLGWTTYSPLLRMDFARCANYAWSRR